MLLGHINQVCASDGQNVALYYINWTFLLNICSTFLYLNTWMMCLSYWLSLFQHPFVSQPLSRTMAIELLDKANNPDHSTYNDFDDDDPEPEVTFDLLGFCFLNKSAINSFQTCQHSGDYVLLDLVSFPSNRALSPHLLIDLLLHQPPFTLLDLSPSFSTCDSSVCSLSFSIFPFLAFFLCLSSPCCPSFHFSCLLSSFPLLIFLFPPCSTSPFSLLFFPHSFSLPFFLLSSCLHPPFSSSSSV